MEPDTKCTYTFDTDTEDLEEVSQLGGTTENFRDLNTPFLPKHSCSFFFILGKALLENCVKPSYKIKSYTGLQAPVDIFDLIS